MSEPARGAVFADGEAYEKFMGRRSRVCGRKFVDWLNLSEGLEWLDAGCGTGALGEVILDMCAPSVLNGIDPSEPQIKGARGKIANSRAAFHIGDAMDMPFGEASFDVAVSSFALNYVPDKQKMMNEMARVVRPGGTVATMVFDHAGGEDPARHFWRPVIARDAAFYEAEFKKRGWDITRPDIIEGFFKAAGLVEIEIHAITFEDAYEDFENFWSSITSVPMAGMTLFVNSLDEGEREEFKDVVRAEFEYDVSHPFEITSRAWAVRAKK
jgi:ubiquinone/menaquinone biosynthesis C-methylase UbiE